MLLLEQSRRRRRRLFVCGLFSSSTIWYLRCHRNIYVAWNIRNESSAKNEKENMRSTCGCAAAWLTHRIETKKKCSKHSIDFWCGEIDRPTDWLPSSHSYAQKTDNEYHKHVIHFSSSSLSALKCSPCTVFRANVEGNARNVWGKPKFNRNPSVESRTSSVCLCATARRNRTATKSK